MIQDETIVRYGPIVSELLADLLAAVCIFSLGVLVGAAFL